DHESQVLAGLLLHHGAGTLTYPPCSRVSGRQSHERLQGGCYMQT
ncbi:hypothetical protein CSPX01_11406, partial [Colletotrichum filicis]